MIKRVNGSRRRRIHPLTGEPLNGHSGPRPRLDELAGRTTPQQRAEAAYDAARTTDEFSNWWQYTDAYDADSAHRRFVRETITRRSRYENGSNGFSAGIANTYADDIIGEGPKLRMLTGTPGWNRTVEFLWNEWAKEVHLARKFWCMGHAYYQDGEGLGVLRDARQDNHPVQLDLILYETEQCQSPDLPFDITVGRVDGVWFDQYGRPTDYDILRQHPGSERFNPILVADKVPAKDVCHWFKLRRPGQHRSVPENTPSLNTGASGRRHREAVISSAEAAANLAVILETGFAPDDIDELAPMSSLEYDRRTMLGLPEGWRANQMRAEHPNAQYESVQDQIVGEQARPISMPRNKALANSANYNFASGRLDHLTYYQSLRVIRADFTILVLEKIWRRWIRELIASAGLLGGVVSRVTQAAFLHRWDFPANPVVDAKAEAEAVDKSLRNGTLTLSRYYAERGMDFEEELDRWARDYGVTMDEARARILSNLYPSTAQAAPTIPPAMEEAVARLVEDRVQEALANLGIAS